MKEQLAALASSAKNTVLCYSQIYFADRFYVGLLLLAATFVVPQQGFAGLAGLLLANLWARFLGQPVAP